MPPTEERLLLRGRARVVSGELNNDKVVGMGDTEMTLGVDEILGVVLVDDHEAISSLGTPKESVIAR